MKKPVQVEQSFCDVCGKQSSGYCVCNYCGKEFCYDCEKTEAVNYAHAVSFSGSGDGLYCNECDQKLTKSKEDKKHNAYRVIASLDAERAGWYADFKKRLDKAEEALKSMDK